MPQQFGSSGKKFHYVQTTMAGHYSPMLSLTENVSNKVKAKVKAQINNNNNNNNKAYIFKMS